MHLYVYLALSASEHDRLEPYQEFSGLSVPQGASIITHLMFMPDVALISDTSNIDIRIFVRYLHTYYYNIRYLKCRHQHGSAG